ncbi:hypothetical protein GCM10023195_74070 [Actinoallomurus liliacearum]|uniref:Uncharacterized protein n=1 Tax=Actinoallomurus liliacearum TaxID=1080073 RepID=A0ABP8TZ83_9ACTN
MRETGATQTRTDDQDMDWPFGHLEHLPHHIGRHEAADPDKITYVSGRVPGIPDYPASALRRENLYIRQPTMNVFRNSDTVGVYST